MAYKNVKNVALSTNKPQTLYQHIRDFLTATGLYNATTGVGGWTALYTYESVPGSVSLNDWCFLKTTGESGTWDFRIFIKNTSSGIICHFGTGISNTSTATPSFVNSGGLTTEAITLPANWTAFYIYADKDFCAIIVRAGTTNYIHRFGIAEPVNPPLVAPAVLQSAITSGSSKAMVLDNSNRPDFAVGNRVLIISTETAGGGGQMESSQISANDTGTNTITVGSNSGAYPAGTLVSSCFPYLCDDMVAKSSSGQMRVMPGFSSVDSWQTGYLYTTYLANVVADSVAVQPMSGRFTSSRVLITTSGIGGTVFLLPSWIQITKKRSTEEELHSDGTDNYRYFSYYNDTATVGFLYKDV